MRPSLPLLLLLTAPVAGCPLYWATPGDLVLPCLNTTDCADGYFCDQAALEPVCVVGRPPNMVADPDAGGDGDEEGDGGPCTGGACSMDGGAVHGDGDADAGACADGACSMDGGGDGGGDGGADGGDCTIDGCAVDGGDAPVDAGAVDGDAGPDDDGGLLDAGADAGPPCIDPDSDGYGDGCPLGPDCAPSEASLHTLVPGYQDVDEDGVTVGPLADFCTDGVLPTSAQPTPSPLADCDDGDALIGSGPDTDGDLDPDCTDPDDDNDLLDDDDELTGATTGFVTNPLAADSDADGVDDSLDAAPLHDFCSAELLFWDDFSADPATTWTALSGTWVWNQAEATYELTSITNGAVTWIGDRPWSDYSVEVQIEPKAGQSDPGLLGRASVVSANNNGGQQYYTGLYPNNDSAVLGFMNDGWNARASAGITIDEDVIYRLRLVMEGTSIETFIDGAPHLAITDTTHGAGGIGLRSYRHRAVYHSIIACR